MIDSCFCLENISSPKDEPDDWYLLILQVLSKYPAPLMGHDWHFIVFSQFLSNYATTAIDKMLHVCFCFTSLQKLSNPMDGDWYLPVLHKPRTLPQTPVKGQMLDTWSCFSSLEQQPSCNDGPDDWQLHVFWKSWAIIRSPWSARRLILACVPQVLNTYPAAEMVLTIDDCMYSASLEQFCNPSNGPNVLIFACVLQV